MWERMPKDMLERKAKDMSERMSERMWERMWEDMSERMPKDMSKRMSGDMSERMAKDMWERMSKDMSERMSEDMSERMSKDMSQRTRIHVCTNGILWMAFCFLFDVAHCSKYCWLNFFFVQGSEFGLAAMAEVVVERAETIFIGTANRVCQRSWACVALQVDFCWCWAHLRVHGAA